jgi:hypothetical protein
MGYGLGHGLGGGVGVGWVMHFSMLYGMGIWVYRYGIGGYGCSLVALVSMICMNANGFSNAKVFSLVNELRIIKKSNLLKFKLFWGC